MNRHIYCLLLVALVLVPTVFAVRLDPLFNTTYVQRLAENAVDFYNNQTVVWSGVSSYVKVGNMTRLLLQCDNYNYNIRVNEIKNTTVKLIVAGNNITVSKGQEIGLDVNNDTVDDVMLTTNRIRYGKVEMTLTNLCGYKPQSLQEMVASNRDALIGIGIVIIFFIWLFRRLG